MNQDEPNDVVDRSQPTRVVDSVRRQPWVVSRGAAYDGRPVLDCRHCGASYYPNEALASEALVWVRRHNACPVPR